MANRSKKLERLHDLKNSVLESILKACEKAYFDQLRLHSSCEIIHNKCGVGEVKFKVAVDTLIPNYTGDYNNPPEPGEFDFILQNSKVAMLYDADGNALAKRTKVINHLLFLEEGKILNT